MEGIFPEVSLSPHELKIFWKRAFPFQLFEISVWYLSYIQSRDMTSKDYITKHESDPSYPKFKKKLLKIKEERNSQVPVSAVKP